MMNNLMAIYGFLRGYRQETINGGTTSNEKKLRNTGLTRIVI